MKGKIRFILLLLVAVCILSVYACYEAVPAALPTEQTKEKIDYHTYRYSIKHITDIEIFAENAAITFHTEPKQEEIVVQINGVAVEEAKKEKALILQSNTAQRCEMDIYLPERFYHIYIEGKSITINTAHTLQGTLTVIADCLKAELNGYCGGISFFAKEGSVRLQNGNLEKTSYVTLKEKGNIYLDTKITDNSGISSFSTADGMIKVQKDALSENTLFEVTALSVFGTYPSLDIAQRKNCAYYKVQIQSQNGIAHFYD